MFGHPTTYQNVRSGSGNPVQFAPSMPTVCNILPEEIFIFHSHEHEGPQGNPGGAQIAGHRQAKKLGAGGTCLFSGSRTGRTNGGDARADAQWTRRAPHDGGERGGGSGRAPAQAVLELSRKHDLCVRNCTRFEPGTPMPLSFYAIPSARRRRVWPISRTIRQTVPGASLSETWQPITQAPSWQWIQQEVSSCHVQLAVWKRTSSRSNCGPRDARSITHQVEIDDHQRFCRFSMMPPSKRGSPSGDTDLRVLAVFVYRIRNNACPRSLNRFVGISSR